MHYRIKLLPPDIDTATQNRLLQEIPLSIQEPDRSLKSFQDAIRTYFPLHSVLGLSSGTAALHLALRVLGVKKGDSVICPTFTFAATVNAILYLQAEPVLVDSERVSWNMDPALVETAIRNGIKEGRKPAAILFVHSYGTPSPMEPFLQLAEQYQIPLLEDAAPAFGAYYKGRMAGTFGDCGAYSFNYNKIITTAGGGLLVSRQEKLLHEAEYLANQAREQAACYIHRTVGYNYRMGGLSASLGTVQLPGIQQKLKRKKDIFQVYRAELQVFDEIHFQDLPATVQPNYWLSSILFRTLDAKEKAFNKLQSAGIECRMLWNPMHLQPAFNHCPAYVNGVAEALFRTGLCLPSGVSLKEQEQDEVIGLIKNLF